jgi:hypothetical protein
LLPNGIGECASGNAVLLETANTPPEGDPKMKKTVLFTLTALTVASACLSRAAAQTQNTGGSSWVGKKSGWQLLKPGEQAQVMKFGEEYKRFMTAARTPATPKASTSPARLGFVNFGPASGRNLATGSFSTTAAGP